VKQLFAIDPGTTESGWLWWQNGVIRDSGVSPNETLMLGVQSMRAPCDLAIEMIASYGMPVGREVFETCVWIGRFQQAWHTPSAVRLIYRREVKLHLCGTTKAKDPNVWQALLDKFGGETAVGRKASPGPLYGVKSHARAALAVAITAMEVTQ